MTINICLDDNVDVDRKNYRELTGLIKQIRFRSFEHDRAVYEIVLKSWLDLATLTSDFRMFQNKSVTEIILEVLSDHPFKFETRIAGSYPLLEYQVQYGESDSNSYKGWWRNEVFAGFLSTPTILIHSFWPIPAVRTAIFIIPIVMM